MADKAPIMIPDSKAHRKDLIENNGYREGFLIDATKERMDTLTLLVQDRKTGREVEVSGTSISALYGANKNMLPPETREELDEVYTPTSEDALDLEKVASKLLVSPERVEGVRFVYHESFFE